MNDIKQILLISTGVVIIILSWFAWSSNFDKFNEQASRLQIGMSKAAIIMIMGEPTTVDTSKEGSEIWGFRPPRGRFAEWPLCYFVLGDSTMSEFWWEPIHLTTPNLAPHEYRPGGVFLPENGCVPDEATAKQIAEAVWLPVYGETIHDEKPFQVELVADSVWVIVGTLPQKYALGGVAYIEIRKKDGCILGMGHSK